MGRLVKTGAMGGGSMGEGLLGDGSMCMPRD